MLTQNSFQNQPISFHLMTKPGGAICNLNCEYCYFLSKEMLYPGSRFHMAYETLESYIKQYIELQGSPEVTFAWQGGEPTLLGLKFYEHAVELQQKHKRPGMCIINTLQTNGTQLNDEWCSFFKTHSFLIGLSVDGPQVLHDTYRVDKGGKATFKRVMKGLDFLKTHGVEFNILTTLHAANAEHPLEVYRFLRDEVNTRYIQFIPIVERSNDTGFQEGVTVTERSITGEQYGRFLNKVFDEWVRHDVGRIYVQLFDVTLGKYLGVRGGLCVFEEACGRALALEHNGDVYSCDHYVEPDSLLGNLIELPLFNMVTSPKQQEFGQAKEDTLPDYCRLCKIRFVCNGGCPKDRILTTTKGKPGLNYLCDGYKAFFTHTQPFMHFMANELRAGRAPANIMRHLMRDETFLEGDLSRMGRNEP